MKEKLLALTRKPWFTASLALVLFVCAGTIYFLTRPPAPQPIPLGFTMVEDTPNEVMVTTIENVENLRLIYTTGMLVVDDKTSDADDPYSIGGLIWFYRVDGNSPYKVVVISGQSKVAEYTNIMNATNQCTENPVGDPCSAGAIKLLTTKMETIYVETNHRQFVVINP